MRLERAAALALTLAVSAAPARAFRTETFSAGVGVAGGASAPMVVTSGQALVRLSSGTDLSVLDAQLSGLGAVRGAPMSGDWILATWTGAAPVAQRLAALKALPGVLDAQPSHVYSVKMVPNDPSVASQYALTSIDAYRAWEFETGSSSRVTIAVFDSGIQGSHPDLSPKLGNTVSMAYDPTSGVGATNNPPTPACQHATEVAGVAAAATNNANQIAGASWGAQLVSYKVFRDADCSAVDCSDPSCQTNDPALISALNQTIAVQNTAAYGQMVVNMSLGGAGSCSGALQTAVTNAVNAGVVVIAAAGNDGLSVNQPGNCSGVIPAGAVDSGDNVASFSSRDAGAQTVMTNNGLVAPGVAVLTTNEGGGTSTPSGTSFASPMVAGVAALILSAKPGSTPAQVKADLRGGADRLSNYASAVQGAGRLNAYNSVYLALKGTLPAANSVNTETKPFAFPNPMRLGSSGGSQISVPPSLKGGTIKIYTMDGRIVRSLSSPIWDGRNDAGNMVASGSYLFVVALGGKSESGRLAVIR